MQEQVLDHEEIEWQLDAVDLELVENWLQQHPSAAGVAIVPGPERELKDAYFDTEDWRLYRAAYALRVRRDGQSAQATMKALVPPEGGLRTAYPGASVGKDELHRHGRSELEH